MNSTTSSASGKSLTGLKPIDRKNPDLATYLSDMGSGKSLTGFAVKPLYDLLEMTDAELAEYNVAENAERDARVALAKAEGGE